MTSVQDRSFLRVTGASVAVVTVLLALLEGIRVVGANPTFDWTDPLVLGFGALVLAGFAVTWVFTNPAFED